MLLKRIIPKLIAIICMAIALLTALPAQASMLMPFGGWVMDEHTLMKVYTDYSKILRISAQNILKYDADGAPDTETITWVDYPFDGKSTALGYRHCKAKPESTRIAVVYSPDDNKVYKAWAFDGKTFNQIDEKTVVCDRSFAE